MKALFWIVFYFQFRVSNLYNNLTPDPREHHAPGHRGHPVALAPALIPLVVPTPLAPALLSLRRQRWAGRKVVTAARAGFPGSPEKPAGLGQLALLHRGSVITVSRHHSTQETIILAGLTRRHANFLAQSRLPDNILRCPKRRWTDIPTDWAGKPAKVLLYWHKWYVFADGTVARYLF